MYALHHRIRRESHLQSLLIIFIFQFAGFQRPQRVGIIDDIILGSFNLLAVFPFFLFTGMRIGEACALEWKDVDFQNNYLHVYKTINIVPVYYDDNGNKLDRPYYIKQITSPKRTASIRKIPLFKAAVDALYSWREKQLADKRKYKKSGGLKICY